ncbi:MAG: hypothetical protein WBM41_06290 [Arenicellales bacterium]|jgi:hypothetical protein
MKIFTPLLVALFLLGGCSSKGGTTSSGDGLGVQTTQGDLLLLTSLIVNDSPSVDAIQDICDIPDDPDEDPTLEPGLSTTFGTLTINSRDLMDSSGLTPIEFFPEGVSFDRYRVSFIPANSFAPNLRDRVYLQTMTLPNGTSTASFQVVLVDLDLTLPEFAAQTSGSIASYNVKVTASGAEFNGTPIDVSATTFLEMGNFDRCST